MRYLAIICIVLLSSCAAKKRAAEFAALPDWVKSTPIESGYYIGVGNVKKIGTAAQYTRRARQQALAEIAESVSTNVSSSSVLRTISDRHGSSQSFNQTIKTSSDDYLEGFEPIASHETESDYWVYYKISESTYREMKARKKKEAVDAAFAKYLSGIQEEKAYRPKEALAFYAQALAVIKRYLNEETPVTHEGKDIDLGNSIYSKTTEVISDLKIDAKEKEVKMKRGQAMPYPLHFSVAYRGKAAMNIPVKLRYSGGYLKNDLHTSNEEGKLTLEPERLLSKSDLEHIYAEIDLTRLIQKSVDDVFIRGLLLQEKLEAVSVTLEVIKPSMVLSIPNEDGSKNEQNRIFSVYHDNLNQFRLKSCEGKKCDYYLHLSYTYEKGEQAAGLQSYYLVGDLELRNQNTTLWNKHTERFKGVGNNADEAKQKAFNAFLKGLERKYFKQAMDKVK